MTGFSEHFVVRLYTGIKITYPVWYPRVSELRDNLHGPLYDHLSASTTSHMIESPAKVTDVLNSSRLPSKPPFI